MVISKNNLNNIILIKIMVVLFLLPLVLTGCLQKETTTGKIIVEINYDGKQAISEIDSGLSVNNILDHEKIIYSALDRIDPSPNSIVSQNSTITIIRVKEAFVVQEKSIPFEPQTVFNEALPKGQHMNIQEGKNGTQNITYRVVYENDKEVSRSIVKTEIIIPSKPQIEMVGVQAPTAPVDFPGVIVYLSSGNAWKVDNSTGNRNAIVTTGDLDGHIFSLSENRKSLLFTRKLSNPSTGDINSLWYLDLTVENGKPVDLGIKNIIHFAAWKPGNDRTIGYSTVEPRSSSPGWQANNNLIIITFDSAGKQLEEDAVIATNNGGVYGWWGIKYFWSPNGQQIAYSRPDGIGLVDLENHELKPLKSITPFQTGSNWAWIPGLSWSPDEKIFYFVNHHPTNGLDNQELSQNFELSAKLVSSSDVTQIGLVQQSGLFAYPVSSPPLPGNRFQVAYMQSIFPDQSHTSRYQLMVIDQDGSNKKKLFPPDGSQGMEPQSIIWGPRTEEGGETWVALIYQGKLNLINNNTGEIHQITGDNSVIKVDWK